MDPGSSDRASEYLPRIVDDQLAELMSTFPAVMLTGARASGKSTSAAQHVQHVVRLDEPGTAAAWRVDPDAALRRTSRPVLLDEWQIVPEVLPALKRAVDADPTPGQVVLASSVRAPVHEQFWAGTGRQVHLTLHGLTERELAGRDLAAASTLRRLVEGRSDELTDPVDPPDIDGYLDLALRGGSPFAALRLGSERSRRQWHRSYLEDVVTRDAELAGSAKDPAKLRTYLEVLALSTAGQPSASTLYQAAGINARTAAGYDQLLVNLHLLDLVPAWTATGNRLAGLAKGPKRYLTDSALAAAAAGFTAADVLEDVDLLGRVFDTYAMSQLRPEAAALDPPARRHHLRAFSGREVDVVLDLGRRRVLGIEVKASSTVSRSDARHLVALRDDLGPRFVAGVVLHAGRHVVELDDRILALPLCCLWS